MLMLIQGLIELRKEYRKICIDTMLREEWYGVWKCFIVFSFGFNSLIWCKFLIEFDGGLYFCGVKFEFCWIINFREISFI